MTSISSVFGEARPSSAQGFRYRFHTGVDLPTYCANDKFAYAIKAGTATTVPECTNPGQCRRILASDGTTFDYIHLDPASVVALNSFVVAGSTVGKIQSGPLHLAETASMAGSRYAINPQRVSALDFSDMDTIQLKNTTVGSATDNVIPVVESPLNDDGQQTSTQPFTKRNSVYYISGQADILVNGSGRPGTCTDPPADCRKGLFIYGYKIFSGTTLQLMKSGWSNLAMWSINDDQTRSKEGTDTVIFRRNADSATNFATNMKLNWIPAMQARDDTWDTTQTANGPVRICARLKNFPAGTGKQLEQDRSNCVDGVVHNVAPTITLLDQNGSVITYASSMTMVSVVGTDSVDGIEKITLLKPNQTTSTQTFSGVIRSATATFSGLADGQYLATVYHLAGSQQVARQAFIIAAADPSTDATDDKDGPIVDVIPSSRCLVIHARDTVAGIASISISGAGLSKTMSFPCGVPAKSTDVYAGAFCSLTENSTYTFTATSCTGKHKVSSPISVSTSTNGGVICVSAPAGNFCGSVGSLSDAQLRTYGMRMRVCMTAWPNNCNGMCDVTGWDNIVSAPIGSAYCGIGPSCCRVITWDAPLSNKSFSVTNSTDVTSRDSGSYEFAITTTASEGQVSIAILNSPNFTMTQGQATSGTIDVAQIGQGYPTISPDGVGKIDSPFTRLHFSLQSFLDLLFQLTRNLLRTSSPYIYNYLGSDAIFASTTTLTFTYVDTVNTDTTTVRIYMFDGVSWSSAGITSQSVSYATVGSTTTLTISGSVDRTGLYAALYQAQDSSAPVTTFSLQGSSFVFDGALFVSTDAFIVLTATDPAVNGFASTVASITYRLDPSSGSPFLIYSSSIPLPLGTHVFEYRSLDYAGNAEAVKTATFTVTAGTAFRTANTAQVPGVLLNGFLGSGAKLEIESRAENSLTLLVSSANRQALVSVDNIGQVGVGMTPQANLDIGTGAIGLQLRSGNSTSSVTSNQIAFGYNGDYSMRHLLRTEHSTAAHGNKMDFLVWNTGAASTTTVAGLNVLSLQGIATASKGSFHVQPVGEPDAEVEVSNGLSTGGGTMQRLQVVAPSSRRFKTDIKDLSEKDEDRALSDVAGLKHARFRYKVRQNDGRLVEDPAQAMHTGLIYEESPESIREGGESLSTSERLVNVELALKASMRRLENLQKRYEQLKARRRNP